MPTAFRKPPWKTAGLLGAVALGLFSAPPKITEPIRVAVRDGLRPGQRALQSSTEWVTTQRRNRGPFDYQDREQVTALRTELRSWQDRYRRLQIEAAQLRDQMETAQQQGAVPFQGRVGKPLLIPQLLTAAVLGEETAAKWQAGRFIDKGQTHGVSPSTLVVDVGSRLIDQGADANIAAGQPVLAGRCVVGRIAQVGHWTSTVQLVTDGEFRGFAQLVRPTSQGFVFGTRGILEGIGDTLCRLRFISSTEAVQVGDEVYTGDRDGALPSRLYYGQVVRAELEPHASHWEIWVKPAVADMELQTVQVLRTKLNPARRMSNDEARRSKE